MARHYVSLPVEAFNSFDLPPVCFVTGSTENVVWRKRVYRWTPGWILFLIVCFPVGVFLSVWMHRTVRVEVPVTESAWRKWKIADSSGGLAFLTALLAGIAALTAAGASHPNWAIALLIFALSSPFIAFAASRRYQGPRPRRITEDSIELIVRNDAVAEAIRQHFAGQIVETP